MKNGKQTRPATRLAAIAISLAAVLTMGSGSQARADEEPALRIEPGLWRFKNVSTMPMSSQPQSRTTTECVRDGRRTASEFTKDSSPGCKFSDVVVRADTMKWRMTCNQGGSKVVGDADFHSTGTTVSGAVHMTMEHGGMKLAFEQTLSGTRTGDCE